MMIDQRHYRKATSPADLAYLLQEGVDFITGSANHRVTYNDKAQCRFTYTTGEEFFMWGRFREFEPVIPKPHWSDKARKSRPIPCFLWDGSMRPRLPCLGYLIGVLCGEYIDSGGNSWVFAEPIREEDR